jgi:hypothetical protein
MVWISGPGIQMMTVFGFVLFWVCRYLVLTLGPAILKLDHSNYEIKPQFLNISGFWLSVIPTFIVFLTIFMFQWNGFLNVIGLDWCLSFINLAVHTVVLMECSTISIFIISVNNLESCQKDHFKSGSTASYTQALKRSWLIKFCPVVLHFWKTLGGPSEWVNGMRSFRCGHGFAWQPWNGTDVFSFSVFHYPPASEASREVANFN